MQLRVIGPIHYFLLGVDAEVDAHEGGQGFVGRVARPLDGLATLLGHVPHLRRVGGQSRSCTHMVRWTEDQKEDRNDAKRAQGRKDVGLFVRVYEHVC